MKKHLGLLALFLGLMLGGLTPVYAEEAGGLTAEETPLLETQEIGDDTETSALVAPKDNRLALGMTPPPAPGDVRQTLDNIFLYSSEGRALTAKRLVADMTADEKDLVYDTLSNMDDLSREEKLLLDAVREDISTSKKLLKVCAVLVVVFMGVILVISL